MARPLANDVLIIRNTGDKQLVGKSIPSSCFIGRPWECEKDIDKPNADYGLSLTARLGDLEDDARLEDYQRENPLGAQSSAAFAGFCCIAAADIYEVEEDESTPGPVLNLRFDKGEGEFGDRHHLITCPTREQAVELSKKATRRAIIQPPIPKML